MNINLLLTNVEKTNGDNFTYNGGRNRFKVWNRNKTAGACR